MGIAHGFKSYRCLNSRIFPKIFSQLILMMAAPQKQSYPSGPMVMLWWRCFACWLCAYLCNLLMLLDDHWECRQHEKLWEKASGTHTQQRLIVHLHLLRSFASFLQLFPLILCACACARAPMSFQKKPWLITRLNRLNCITTNRKKLQKCRMSHVCLLAHLTCRFKQDSLCLRSRSNCI